MKTAFILCFVLCSSALYAQNNTYEKLFKEGKEAYQKHEYYFAYQKFRAARQTCKPCPPNLNDSLFYWIDKAFEGCNQQAQERYDSLEYCFESLCFRKATNKNWDVFPREYEIIDSLDFSNRDYIS